MLGGVGAGRRYVALGRHRSAPLGTARIVLRSPVGFRIPIAGFRLLGISQERVRTRKNLILPCFLRHIRNVLKSLFFFLVQKRPNEISTIMMCCKKQGKITFFGDEKNWWRAPLSALPGFFQVGAGVSPNLQFFRQKRGVGSTPPSLRTGWLREIGPVYGIPLFGIARKWKGLHQGLF